MARPRARFSPLTSSQGKRCRTAKAETRRHGHLRGVRLTEDDTARAAAGRQLNRCRERPRTLRRQRASGRRPRRDAKDAGYGRRSAEGTAARLRARDRMTRGARTGGSTAGAQAAAAQLFAAGGVQVSAVAPRMIGNAAGGSGGGGRSGSQAGGKSARGRTLRARRRESPDSGAWRHGRREEHRRRHEGGRAAGLRKVAATKGCASGGGAAKATRRRRRGRAAAPSRSTSAAVDAVAAAKKAVAARRLKRLGAASTAVRDGHARRRKRGSRRTRRRRGCRPNGRAHRKSGRRRNLGKKTPAFRLPAAKASEWRREGRTAAFARAQKDRGASGAAGGRGAGAAVLLPAVAARGKEQGRRAALWPGTPSSEKGKAKLTLTQASHDRRRDYRQSRRKVTNVSAF